MESKLRNKTYGQVVDRFAVESEHNAILELLDRYRQLGISASYVAPEPQDNFRGSYTVLFQGEPYSGVTFRSAVETAFKEKLSVICGDSLEESFERALDALRSRARRQQPRVRPIPNTPGR